MDAAWEKEQRLGMGNCRIAAGRLLMLVVCRPEEEVPTQCRTG